MYNIKISIMKRFLLFAIVLITFSSIKAQTKEGKITCHQKYAQVFEKRGANPVEDGVYDNVIITFRKGSLADCFYGKVHVIKGKINTLDMHLKFADDSYERIQRKFRYPDEAVTIEGGMSRVMVTEDDELITILFIKNIRPKKKAYLKAVEPDLDF
jgi:hypothetical protein